MTVIYFMVGFFLICSILTFICYKNRQDELIGIPVTAMFIVGILFTGIFFVVLDEHAENYGTITTYHEVFCVYDKQLKELKDRLDDINLKVETDALALANHDTPFKSYIQSYLNTQNKLADIESKTALAKVNIAQRKQGAWGFIVAMYGEPDYNIKPECK